MNRYKIEFQGQVYTVEAASDQEALDFVRSQAAPVGNPPPPGMTAQEAGEAALLNAYAESAYRAAPVAAGVASAARGVPFIGEYFDEAVGVVGGEDRAEQVRLAREGFETANPMLATGLQIGTGVATGLAGGYGLASAATRFAPGAVSALTSAIPTSTVGQVAAGTGAGIAAGALEGGVSGYGAGDGGDRAASARDRAIVGGAIGGAVSAAAPVVGRVVRNAAGAIREAGESRAAREIGTSREAADLVGGAIRADSPGAIRNIRAGGEGAMLADAGPTAAGMLDTAIQTGPGAAAGRRAVEGRVSAASRDLTVAIDDALGRPIVANPVSAGDRAAISAAYRDAYSRPIDYSAAAGREIEELLPRVDPAAINAANRLMRLEGVQSAQILADVADDGSVTFRTLPDVRQLDYITRGLNQLAEAGEDAGALGGRTPISRALTNLSREIRGALKDAVPEYATALNRAATGIEQVKARDLGEIALLKKTKLGDLAEEIASMPTVAVQRLREGMRAHIEETMANTRRAVSDGNMEAREALDALRLLSSRAATDKMKLVLGDGPAATLTRRIEQVTKAFELRANVATNARTAGRLATRERIRDAAEPTALQSLMEGSVGDAGKRVTRALTGVAPDARRQVEDRIHGDIVRLLTEPRGREAQRKAVALLRLLDQAEATQPLARRIGRDAGVLTAVGGYQLAVPRQSTPQ